MELPGRRESGRPAEEEHTEGRCDRGGCYGEGEMEVDDQLCRPLKGAAERQKRKALLGKHGFLN